MVVAALWPFVLAATAALASSKPTRSSPTRRQNIEFVTAENGQFTVKGSPLKFVGTNAYWLHTLNTDEDIDYTLGNISATGFKVVRTWAFNDVTSEPEVGPWFQLIHPNGTATINDGPRGLQRLDKVVELAEKHGLYLLLSLTNNWSPGPESDDPTVGSGPVRRTDIVVRNNEKLPRNYLSNDYGGMDTYIRALGLKSHDEFYTNVKAKGAFKNYVTTLVKRYSNSPAIFAWELANDPRCNSTIAASTCDPKIITKWHADVGQTVKKADPNHLVGSGAGGHLCVGCPKVFPRPPPPPPPAPSPAPGQGIQTRHLTRRGFLTKADILLERTASFKRNRLLKRGKNTGGTRIRGRWVATATRRQQDLQELGPAYDGTFGVDSEDILNAPPISLGSFQLFPDQYKYNPDDPNLSPFENTVQSGIGWISKHAEASQLFGKPVVLNGFGLVTQQNVPQWVPFNGTSAPYGVDDPTSEPSEPAAPPTEAPYGMTNKERDDAYSAWLNAGVLNGLTSMIHYQWGQDSLSVVPGTTVSEISTGTGVTPETGGTGVSPNDGYSTNGIGEASVIDVIQEAIAKIDSDIPSA